MRIDLEGEIWKDVVGYEGLYQVSNLGRVYALPKEWKTGRYSHKRSHDGKLLSLNISTVGYYKALFSKNGKKRNIDIHQLVAQSFLSHVRCGYKIVVDHINNNKLDNRVENLQLVTQRYNTTKSIIKCSSSYIGVSWVERNKKWRAQISKNNNKVYLGLFNCEIQAHLAYQKALKEL